MPKTMPRVLIPISEQFSVRYVLRTGLLQCITDYARPVIALAWEDTELQAELEQAGAEVCHFLEPVFGWQYLSLKKQIDRWYLNRLKSPSTPINTYRWNSIVSPYNRFRREALNASRRLRWSMYPPARLREIEPQVVAQHTNIHAFERFLDQVQPDALFSLTPFKEIEDLLLRAAKNRGIPLCTAILSFDNLTTRGWIPVIFDEYFLWNRYNNDELRRGYPEAADSKVTIAGPPQLDFHWDASYLWDNDRWRKTLNLPPDRSVILYAAGPWNIAPQEPYWLQHLDDAIANKEIPGGPVLLFRRHPNDPETRWKTFLDHAKHTIYDNPWPAGHEALSWSNVRRADIEKLCSSLYHSQIHINASSTMTIEGAIYDRPQIGPAYDDRKGSKYARVARELYLREHYLPISNSGGLAIVYSRDEMINAIGQAMQNPAANAEGRQRLVREICTYDDGNCTQRVSAALRSFLRNL